MALFKGTSITTLPKIAEPLSDEALFWRNSLELKNVIKEYGAIHYLDFNPFDDELLVTSGSRINLYNLNNLDCKRTYLTSTRLSVYGGSFRKLDGKMIVCGTEEGKILVYDVKSTKPLRVLGDKENTKHTRPVRKSYVMNLNHIASFSDDKTIKIWDLVESRLLHSIGSNKQGEVPAHSDYIRAGCIMENANYLASGSYDSTVKLWDPRCVNGTDAVHEYNHGAPVESVVSRNSLLISAGAKTVKIFDIIAGKVLKTLSNFHHKTITTVCNYDNYIVTGSLDGHIKIIDSYFNVVTSLSYSPAQILSLAINSKAVVVGASDGLVTVRKFKLEKKDDQESENFMNSKRYFKREKEGRQKEDDAVIVHHKLGKRDKLKPYDKQLKKYEHTTALNTVMKNERNNPAVIVSFMQELIRRSALKIAFAGRTDKELKRIAEFLIKQLPDPKYSRILVDVAMQFTETYTPHINRSETIQHLFCRLAKIVDGELQLMQKMKTVTGELNAVMNTYI